MLNNLMYLYIGFRARRPPTGSKGIVPPSTAKHGAGGTFLDLNIFMP